MGKRNTLHMYFKALLLEIKDPQPQHLEFNSGKGLGPILSEAHVKFLQPVLAGDTLVVGATGKLAEGSGSRLLLQHSMWSTLKQRVVCEGSSTVVSFNYNTAKVQDFLPAIAGKPPPLPPRKCLNRLQTFCIQVQLHPSQTSSCCTCSSTSLSPLTSESCFETIISQLSEF
jgi:acyl-CoA thioesterase FadM